MEEVTGSARYFEDPLQWEDRIHDKACGTKTRRGAKSAPSGTGSSFAGMRWKADWRPLGQLGRSVTETSGP